MTTCILARSPDVLLTEAQAAYLLSIKPSTLQMWRMRGSGPAFIRTGSAIRYRQITLSAWLSARSVILTGETLAEGAR